MALGEIITLAGVIVVAIALVLSWRRNGSRQAARDQEYEARRVKRAASIENRIGNVEKKLDDPRTGLGSIKQGVEDQKVHCSGVVAGFAERLKNLEGG